MDIQIKHGEIQEIQCLDCENGSVMKNPDDGEDHKKNLCIKKNPEIITEVSDNVSTTILRMTMTMTRMPHHKTEYR